MSQPERIFVRLLQQRPTPAEGVTTVRVDLAVFFDLAAQVGRDAALLLLTIRALRQRGGNRMPLDDLAWMLRARARDIRGWLDRLAAAGQLVYDATDGTVEIELAEPMPPAWTDIHPAELPLRMELPTHWFIHVLPRLGRASFVAYLYLLRRDGRSAPATLVVSALATDAALGTTLHARWHLRRLRRYGLIAPEGTSGALVVRDPPPLTPAARRVLRHRRMTGTTPRRLLLLAAIVVLVLLAALVLARSAPAA